MLHLHNPALTNSACAPANITLPRRCVIAQFPRERQQGHCMMLPPPYPARMTQDLSPARRRILFALLFEGIGLLLSTAGLMLFSGSDAGTAGGASAGAMIVALAYNYGFNWLFERWEKRQPKRGRDLKRRLLHGALFEGGLMLLLVPWLAFWMGIGLVEAFLYDAGLIAFFAVYTLAFTWAFDRIFGLPLSAR